MADNVAITAGTGTTVAADDIGAGVLAQRVKPVWGPDGTGNDTDVASGKALPVQVRSATGLIPLGEPTDAKSTATDATSATAISIWKQISASVQSLVTNLGILTFTNTRLLVRGEPRVIAAASGQLVRPSNVTAYAANDEVSATSPASLSVTLSDTNDDPVTLNRIVVSSTDTGFGGATIRVWVYNGATTAGTDNATFSTARANFVGTFSGTLRAASDGSVGVLVPDEAGLFHSLPASGAKTLQLRVQVLTAPTPSANGTTFDFTVCGFQGRA